MKNKVVKLVALLLLVMLPFSAFVIYTELTPNQYENTYLAALDGKYERLYNTEGEKIIFIGGSSLPFGLRSDMLAEELGGEYEVINYGLYATLGTKLMMDTARNAIGEGDIVILAPELNTQTYSLYFNPEAVLQATDGISELLRELPLDNKLSLFYNYYKFAFEKLDYAAKGSAPDPIGIYRSDSFNEYGDLEVVRENNIMNNAYDENMLITVTEELLDADFIDYVNEYVAYAEAQGASVYFSYCPVNASAIRSSKAARAEFEAELSARIDCELLGSIENYLIDERYFYDTNFHLNSAGATYYSRALALMLGEKLGIEVNTVCELPEPPALPVEDTVTVSSDGELTPFDAYNGEPNNDYLDYFIYEKNGSSYKIVGVKSEYLDMTEVILPSVYEGKNVTALASNALKGCTELKTIRIGTTYKSLEEAAFSECISLERIYLYELDGNKIAPAPLGLLEGCSSRARIYIPREANYLTGYTWSNYGDKLEVFDKGDT